MCDLLTISSRTAYKASYSLPDFAVCGERNCDGWGVGYFREDGTAQVRKSSHAAYDPEHDTLDAALVKLAKETRSQYFLGHVRFTSCGETCDQNCHPFKLSFLGRDWLFAHNGTCREIVKYESPNDSVPDATNDSARVFEYLRDRILKRYAPSGPGARSLFGALTDATLELINEYDSPDGRGDNFNYVLCDGQLLFVFMHHRPFYMLHRAKERADALILTTCGGEDGGGLTDAEAWHELNDRDRSYGTLMLIVHDTVVNTTQITRGE